MEIWFLLELPKKVKNNDEEALGLGLPRDLITTFYYLLVISLPRKVNILWFV